VSGAEFALNTTQAVTNFNAAQIRNTVGEYWTKSLHEYMAETWASYMMDPTPTQFVMEAGKIMENSLLDYLKDFYGGTPA
jgi:SRSO17 transposase